MEGNCGGAVPRAGVIYLDIPRPPRPLVEAFAEIGVADVYEDVGAEMQIDSAIVPLWLGARVVGPALTVLNAPGDTLMLHRALALSQPGDVMVLTSYALNPSAVWGKLVTTCARARGVAGAIIDGCARDTADIRAAHFPVWTRFISPRGSTRQGPGCINVPVMCGGVRVNPGDLILADDDGIVVVPADRIALVLEKAKARVAREEGMLSQLATGRTPYDVWNLEQAVKEAGMREIPGSYPH
jgi:4-hydroxy-4-methyl-2-oxoglutarate aldolase